MSVLKCKMCGGNVIFEPGATIGICDSCGTRQTLPRIDDDRKNLLLDRANHFRRNGEFDKAAALFEQLINEGALDAEIYWSLVLCRYGIQYVKDPATGRQVPTINRAQYTPVTSDGDYKQALSLADAYQRELYESEAHDIDEIQKGILAISQKEEPFDVFICYKETDDAGRRTKDSVLAQELYYELKERGFKVFFSRITLEDKLGEQYEPYIFAALNSAKVMVVLGTKPEYFNAVWVKNEWSRFLLLIKQGKKKMLIPAYRDMDPYDLPEEFVTLQAQDMSKLGFVQDLVRGIEKITGANKAPVNNGMATPAQTLSQASNKTLSAMLDRGFLSLEDGEFDKAAAFFEDALNIDARNARAYFGLSLVDFKKKTAQELAASTCVISDNKNFKKALRFADAQAIEGLNKIVDATIANRKEQERADIYQRALNKLQQAKSNGDGDWYKEASVLFAQVPGYKSADELTEKCMITAKNMWYARGEELMKKGILNFHQDSFYDAIKSFSKCGEYKDVKEQVAKCQYEIAHIPAYLAAQKLIKDSKTWNNNSIPTLEKIVVALKKTAGYRDADKLLAEYEKLLFDAQQKKNNKKLHVKRFMVIGLPIIVVVTTLAVLLATVFIPLGHYNIAKNALENGDYAKAYQEFSKTNWKDSEEQAKIAQDNALKQAMDLFLFGNSAEANEVLKITGNSSYTLAGILTYYKIKELTLPDGVTTIKEDLFTNCTSLEAITIPNSVTAIESYAFKGCTNLKSITFGSGLLNIGDRAFEGCSNLTSITIPNSVTKIGYGVFIDCSRLSSVIFPNTITSINSQMFFRCSSLSSFNIPNSVISIGASAFDQSGLETITIPDSVTHIGDYAFSGCTRLKTINGSAENTAIVARQCGATGYTINITSGDAITSSAFANLSALKSLNIARSVESIDASAFEGCSRLENITVAEGNTHYVSINNNLVETSTHKLLLGCKNSTIPTDGSITSIGDNAFKGNTSITSITIPAIITNVGDNAFANCSSLTSVTVESPTTILGTNVFANSNNVQTANMPLDILKMLSRSNLKTVVLTTGSTIENEFKNCNPLQNIVIPSSVENITSDAFEGCINLETITVEEGNLQYSSPNNCLVETSTKRLLLGSGNSIIPADGSITTIADNAFKGNIKIVSITIPDMIISIGSNAFCGCANLRTAIVESPSTQIEIDAFNGCNNIQIATLPFEQFKTFSTYNLKKVVLLTGTSVEDVFQECKSLTSISLPNTLLTIPEFAFDGCSKLKSIEIPISVQSIGEWAFRRCTSLESMVLPFVGSSKSTGVNGYPFGYIFGTYDYSGSTSITQKYWESSGNNYGQKSVTYYLPSTLRNIKILSGNITYGAFNGCWLLDSISLGDGVSKIMYESFIGCSGLKTIEISNGVTSIGNDAFNGCGNLSSITFGDNIVQIGQSAFADCISLMSITIPNSVTSIGDKAFYGCNKLVEVYNKSSLSITKGSSANGYIGYYAKNVYTEEWGSKLSSDSQGYIIFTDEEDIMLIGYTGNEQNLVLPRNITTIYKYAFINYSSLKSVIIPNNVTRIEESAFSGCSSLVSLEIPFVGDSCKTSTDVYQYPFGYIFGTNYYYGGTATKQSYYAKSLSSSVSTTYYIPATLRSVTVTGGDILHGAFFLCNGLTSVIIPSSATIIGSGAFYKCTGLTSIIIPENVTALQADAFSDCSSLKSITLQNNITSIGDRALCNCSQLTSITFNGAMSTWNAIPKGLSWDYNTGTYRIYCSNGNIVKS